MLRLALAAAVISLLAACSSMSHDASARPASATMGGPSADWMPGTFTVGPN